MYTNAVLGLRMDALELFPQIAVDRLLLLLLLLLDVDVVLTFTHHRLGQVCRSRTGANHCGTEE